MGSSQSAQLRPELPLDMPDRMKRLQLDDRGYPIPWFVAWLRGTNGEEQEAPDGEGRPEFRLMSRRKLVEAAKFSRCWVCGGPLGKYKAYVIGPMCLVNRINAEPPSHVACADWSARACPFLTRPHARRRDDNMPEGSGMAGVGIKRNPGLACVYVTAAKTAPFSDRKGGVLFALGDPSELRFYAEGRQASMDEIEESIRTGLPALLEVCANDEERQEVQARAERATHEAAQALATV